MRGHPSDAAIVGVVGSEEGLLFEPIEGMQMAQIMSHSINAWSVRIVCRVSAGMLVEKRCCLGLH